MYENMILNGPKRITDGGRDYTDSKVGRVIEEFGLTGLGAELEARWTGAAGSRSSLRELADAVNKQLLAAALEEAGHSLREGEIAERYAALTDDDVSSGVRTRVRRELERKGIDVDALTDDFVSHQAVHTYLTKYREAELTTDETDRVSKALETIRRLRSRMVAVVENSLERLRQHGDLSIGEFEVFVQVQVTCTECGTQYDLRSLLEGESCNCDSMK
jgi:DNA-binding transcriptional ArsR family regulator